MCGFVIGTGLGVMVGLTIVLMVERPEILDGVGVWIIRKLADLA